MTGAINRRQFLWQSGGGLGGIALSYLLGQDGLMAAAGPARADLNGGIHHRARAKRVVQLFMSGAASQCDTFDFKPMLIEKHGKKFDPGGKVELFQSSPGSVMKSPWKWRQHGKCGKWISDLLPNIASCVDDMAFIHSMVAKSNVHGPATFMQATGFVLPGFPSMGAWISYGLGSLQRQPTHLRRPARLSRLRTQRAGQLGRGVLAGGSSGDDGSAGSEESYSGPLSSRGSEGDHPERDGGAWPAGQAQPQAS